ncbi:MAG: 2-oxoacid:ferredoxin oxidoreductase subunit beta, partial [Propionibacteriaceae bacterium]|nr:2-oxoacid:ferredoxin oxidoreductase subunit beta [Propionibacteriaceae bacterium]
VARTIDSNRAHLKETLERAVHTPGAALVEIYQNCPIFNDNAFDGLKHDPEGIISLRDGEPIVFGEDGERCVVRGPNGTMLVANTADVKPQDIVVHDVKLASPAQAFEISRLTDSGVLHQAPIGVFRDVERPAYDDAVRHQVSIPQDREDSLQEYITGKITWEV